MANIIKDQAFMEFPLQINRQYGAPLDAKEIWYNLEEAKAFAKSGATSYVGETLKVVNEDTKVVDIYVVDGNGELVKVGSEKHTHQATDIIEDTNHKFVKDSEKTRWNDTYTKSETDEKLKTAVGGLAFKGTFGTLADLPSKEEAQDGWFAIVVNEPTAKGKNILVIFESTTKEWKQLGDLLVPGVATEDLDGLMGKEMVKALNQAKVDIGKLKDGSLLPKASASQLGVVKQGANITIAEDGTISTHAPYEHPLTHEATMIVEDASHRFVSDADKAVYADKYTKKEADTKISEAITASEEKVTNAYVQADTALKEEITNAYKAADVVVEGKITALGTTVREEFAAADTKLKGEIEVAYKAADKVIDDKVNGIDSAYKAADTALDTKLTKAFGDADTALESKITKAYEAVDTAIRSEFAAADQVIEGKVTALTETHNNDKAALDAQIKAVDAKFVYANDEQILSLFK